MVLVSNTTFQANTNIITTDTGSLVIDYSEYLNRIATAAENISESFKTVTPASILGLTNMYKFLIATGYAANTEGYADAETVNAAKDNILNLANDAINFVATLPTINS